MPCLRKSGKKQLFRVKSELFCIARLAANHLSTESRRIHHTLPIFSRILGKWAVFTQKKLIPGSNPGWAWLFGGCVGMLFNTQATPQRCQTSFLGHPNRCFIQSSSFFAQFDPFWFGRFPHQKAESQDTAKTLILCRFVTSWNHPEVRMGVFKGYMGPTNSKTTISRWTAMCR